MTLSLDVYLVIIAALLVLSVVGSKLSDRFGIPILLVFLALGMLAGSEGLGGIYFDDPVLAQNVGVVALAVILFSGGLDTEWKSIRPLLKEGALLATLGVLITALIVAAFTHFILDFAWRESFLVGAIVSSTDAAAVFALLRARGVRLKGALKPLLELESGSNDPMAVFLTVGMIQVLTQPGTPLVRLLPLFVVQMGLGALFGVAAGKLALFLINRLKLGYSGLYPVLALGLVFLTYGLTALAGGSGFLAVYLTGIVMGRQDYLHKRSLTRFYDGLAWLMQIVMFLTMGLLVFPSQVKAITVPALILSAALILVARPVSVLICLAFTRYTWAERAFVSWVGLRGAVPIVLATYPFLAGIPHSTMIFNIVFFVVLTSVLFQGTSIPLVARWLKVDEPEPPPTLSPFELIPRRGLKSELKEIRLPAGSPAVGKAIYELGLPPDFLIVLVAREGKYLLPNGSIVLQGGDTLMALSEPQAEEQACRILLPDGVGTPPVPG